jgi:Glycosyl transferase family 2
VFEGARQRRRRLAAALEASNAQIERLEARLESTEARLDEATGTLADLKPDEIGQTRAMAEDALARADHALARAGDAVARSESLGADGLARADHALARAGDAIARAESLGADALARADLAVARADDALARADDGAEAAVARAESLGADSIARADHALERAGDAVAKAESLGADGIARADHALARADDAVAKAESLGADGIARADHALARADDAVMKAESLGADGIARADHALERAGDAIARAESLGADGIARADHALARADDAVAKAESLGADAVGRATHALERAGDAVARAESLGADGIARADHALARADDALTRAQEAVAVSDYAAQAVREALLPARMAAFAAWLELCPPLDALRLSVVLPTRDRPALLPRAVASMLEQLYDGWELIVVDDGDTDAVEDVLADVEDERIVTVAGPRRGLGAARNAGLDAATGDVVCYLDDDNVMHPAWLRAVAHIFSTREDVDVLYGVTLAEHRAPGDLTDQAWWPAFWQLPWSREALLRENLTDAGALAHRRELPEARFQEEMGEDWDLLIRLTADRPALAVPAISHAYAIDGEDHMSHDLSHRAALEDVRRRHAGG